MSLEQLGNGNPEGCVAPGIHRKVIQSVGATRTLKADESGSLCLLDRAAGVVYTLPTPVAGMQFEFEATVAVTSNAYTVQTGAATEFILGAVTAGELAAAMDVFQADGTAIVKISANGSTTGGLIGERYVLTAINSTQWLIHGVTVGSGTLATPFA